MSGVSRLPRIIAQQVAAGKALGMVDPTVEITQPGGPFPYGEAILTDGGGGYTIAATLRPYLYDLRVPSQVGREHIDCEFNGVSTSTVGVILPLTTNLIAITVVVDVAVRKDASYVVEVVEDSVADPKVIATLVLDASDVRKAFRRDLSVEIKAGSELGVRVRQITGERPSVFSIGRVGIELEA